VNSLCQPSTLILEAAFDRLVLTSQPESNRRMCFRTTSVRENVTEGQYYVINQGLFACYSLLVVKILFKSGSLEECEFRSCEMSLKAAILARWYFAGTPKITFWG